MTLTADLAEEERNLHRITNKVRVCVTYKSSYILKSILESLHPDLDCPHLLESNYSKNTDDLVRTVIILTASYFCDLLPLQKKD